MLLTVTLLVVSSQPEAVTAAAAETALQVLTHVVTAAVLVQTLVDIW